MFRRLSEKGRSVFFLYPNGKESFSSVWKNPVFLPLEHKCVAANAFHGTRPPAVSLPLENERVAGIFSAALKNKRLLKKNALFCLSSVRSLLLLPF